MRSRVLQVAVALVSTTAACAHGGWVSSNSANVTVYTDAKVEHEFIQEWLELSHAAYSAFFPELRLNAIDVVWLRTEPGSVFYTPNDDPAYGWTLETMPSKGPIGKNGLIVLERKVQTTAESASMVGSRDEALAKRQMAHHFIAKAVPTAPLWLQVGLARYMAKFRMHYHQNVWMVCFGSSWFDEPPVIPGQIDRTGRNVTVPVGSLFNADWYEYDKSRRYWYEYTAYALVHYLIHGEKGFNRSRFPVLLRVLREGKTSEEALATAYPHVLGDEWDERVAIHIRPNPSRARVASLEHLRQGHCVRIPPANHAQMKPKRRTADPEAVAGMLDDLERVDIFHRHSGWFPQDIVEAEAAKRPSKRRGTATGTGTGTEGRGGAADDRRDDGTTPTVTVPIPPPPK